MEFAATGREKAPPLEGHAALRHARDDRTWTTDIPGQPAGSVVTYHAVFSTGEGTEFRHPARAPAAYRFRIVPLKPVSVRLPGPRDLDRGRAPIRVRVEARAIPSGTAVVRLHGQSVAAPSKNAAPPEELQIALSVARRGPSGASASFYEMAGDLPAPQAGSIVDFYIEVRLPSGEEIRIPADAPSRVYSVKRPFVAVRRIPAGRSFVLDLATVGRRRFIGLKGGGVQVVGPGSRARQPGPEAGLISRVARFVLPDAATGQVYLGTDSGVVELEASGESWVAIGPPRASAWGAGSPATPFSDWLQRAGPGALSPLDGTFIFQVQEEDAESETPGPATLVRLVEGRANETKLPDPGMPLVGLSAAGFDPVGGCWLFGGSMREGVRGLRPAVMESCGGAVHPKAVIGPDVAGGSYAVARVVALARDPSTGSTAVAVELLHGEESERRQEYGVYRLESETGRLSSYAAGLDLVGAEVTSLAADWRRGRLLIGTLGRGVLAVRQGGILPPVSEPGPPEDVSSLRVDDGTGAILVGTTRGAFEIPPDGGRARPIGPGGDGPLLADALPMDLDRATGRLLLSSHFEGIVHLAAAGGGWEVAGHLRPGNELPEGFYGDARYGPSGSLIAILRTRGLLVREDGRSRLIGPGEGLAGSLPFRVLARRNGEIWVAHSPLPFGGDTGAAVQVIRDGRVERTIEIAGRNLATIARWLEVPERDSVFAATRAGIVEFRSDGTFERLSGNTASSVALDPATASIGLVGSQVERWDGGRFVPVLFGLRHPRRPADRFQPGSPLDLAIDRNGTWFLLYPGGVVAILRPDRGFLGLLDPEDGIPPAARLLLAHPDTGEIFVGSDGGGLVVLGPAP